MVLLCWKTVAYFCAHLVSVPCALSNLWNTFPWLQGTRRSFSPTKINVGVFTYDVEENVTLRTTTGLEENRIKIQTVVIVTLFVSTEMLKIRDVTGKEVEHSRLWSQDVENSRFSQARWCEFTICLSCTFTNSLPLHPPKKATKLHCFTFFTWLMGENWSICVSIWGVGVLSWLKSCPASKKHLNNEKEPFQQD